MKKIILSSCILAASFSAEAYQVEVIGDVSYYDSKLTNGNFDTGVQGTYYLKDLDTSKGPLAEAAFLNQATSISAAYNYSKLTADIDKSAEIPNNLPPALQELALQAALDKGLDENFQAKIKSEQQSYGFKAEGYYPVNNIPLYASAAYNHTKYKAKTKFTELNVKGDDSGDRYSLELGAMVVPNLLVALGYTNIAAHNSLDTFDVLSNNLIHAGMEARTIGAKKDVFNARVKYLNPLANTDMSIGVEAKVLHSKNTMYELQSDLYVTSKLGFGLGYSHSDHDGKTVPTSEINVSASYFVTPNISAGINFVHAMNNNGGKNINLGGIEAKYRF